MLRDFFDPPYGNGAGLKLYMFQPGRCLHALKLLVNERSYFVARVKVILDQLLHPGDPWLTRASIVFLASYLRRDMRGFEYGSGRSTKWFARRVAHLISVEDNALWYERVKPFVSRWGVDYRLVETDNDSTNYISQLADFPKGVFDFIVIDGSYRDRCIAAAAPRVKPGGIIVLDNADERRDLRPLQDFTRHSTHNGVWQTDIFIRPAAPEIERVDLERAPVRAAGRAG